MRFATMLVRIPGNWIGNLSTTCDLSVRVLKCVPREGGGGQSLLEIDSPQDLTGTEIAEKIRTMEPKCRIQLASVGPGRHLGTIENTACSICRLVADKGCFLDSAASKPDGQVEWNLIAPNSAALNALVGKIEALGCTVQLRKVVSLSTVKELTRAQERVLQLAFDLGYFDIPRKTTLGKLAKRLEISKATLDVMLRRALKKVLSNHVDERA